MASESQDSQLVLPIIDSHIHLFPASEADAHNWYTPESPLASQHSVEQYSAAAESSPSLLGFVFVETDRKNDVAAGAGGDPAGWKGPLDEIRWMSRIALGKPRDGEGHTPEDAKRCLGLVPWAPVASGPEVLEKYLELAEEAAGEAWFKVKGFRFLLQDKPHGTMITDEFIEGLKFLGRKGYVFDVGVDHHRRGKKQLDETLDMIDRAHEGVADDEKVTFILNHLCKPDLTIYNTTSDPAFHAWRTAIYSMSKCSNVYMKLSGAFSEMPTSLQQASASPTRIFEATLAWLGIVLATFGPARTMYGSDWPVCTLAVKEDAWPRWRDVVDKMCWMASLEDEERAMVFGGTAKKAYKL